MELYSMNWLATFVGEEINVSLVSKGSGSWYEL